MNFPFSLKEFSFYYKLKFSDPYNLRNPMHVVYHVDLTVLSIFQKTVTFDHNLSIFWSKTARVVQET